MCFYVFISRGAINQVQLNYLESYQPVTRKRKCVIC